MYSVKKTLILVSLIIVSIVIGFFIIEPIFKGKILGLKLVGFWHGSPTVPSVWNEKYLFYKDGHFRYDYNLYIPDSDRNIDFFGDWFVIKNHLILVVKEKTIIKDGKKVDSSNSEGMQRVIVGGKAKKIKIIIPKIYIYSLGNIEKDYNYDHPTMLKINEVQYWKFLDDPHDYEKVYGINH